MVAWKHAIVIHDLFVLTNPEWYSRTYALTHSVPLIWQIRGARIRFAVSEPIAQRVAAKFRVRPPIVAPNAPAEIFTSPPVLEEVRADIARYGLSERKYLLSVASVDPRKNIARLVEAYNSLPEETKREHRLVLVGGRSAVFGRTNVGDSNTYVDTLGYVTDAELASLYSGAAGVVFPSLDEGFGLPAVEAASRGARILVSDLPVSRWVCEGIDAVYCDPHSVESISAGIVSLLEPALAMPTRTRFDWAESAKTIYQSCSGSPSS